MLTIHYNGEAVPTGRGFSIRISWVNPACRTGEISGNAGLGIDIPVNEHSRMIFGNPERFEKYNAAAARKFPGFQVRFSGVLMIDGVLCITNADGDAYSGWLQSEVGALGEASRDKSIRDIDWGGDKGFINKSYYEEGTDDYCPVTLLNSAFWNGKGREAKVVYEYADEDGETHKVGDTINYLTKKFRELPLNRTVNQFAPDSTILTQGEGCVVSPFLFLRHAIRHILKKCHLYIERNDMVPEGVDLGLAKFLAIYNNLNIMDPEMVTAPMEYTWWDPDSQGWVTGEERVVTGFDWKPGSFNYSWLLPKTPIRDFILGLQNYLNYIFYFKPLGKVDIIDRNAILDGEAIDLDGYFTGQWVIGEQVNVSLKFTSEYDKEDRMYGQEYHDLSDRRKDFREPVNTLDELKAAPDAVIGDLRLVKSENKVYEYKWKVLTYEDALYRENQEDALGWEFVSSGPQPFIYGNSEEIEEIKTGFSTLQTTHNSFFPIPVVLQQGNIRKMKQLWVEFSPRLVITNQVFHPGALDWEGENGLFEKRWKKWSRSWAKRLPVEGKFALPLNMVSYVSNNIHKKFRARAGEFIIDTMETEFSGSMAGLTTIKGYKI